MAALTYLQCLSARTALSLALETLTFDEIWDRTYIAARKWHSEKGNLNVPRDYMTDGGIKLYNWLNNQKTRYANGKLNEKQIANYPK